MKLSHGLNDETLQDLINISTGLFAPLDGFMSSLDYHRVVEDCQLSDNSVWTIPITLNVDHDTFIKAADADRLYLEYKDREVGYVEVGDCYKVDVQSDAVKIFKTADDRHPGARKELGRSKYRVGGRTVVTDHTILDNSLRPEKTRKIFAENGWKTIVAFNTRNPIHRAHEHLQRVGLDLCDGLFVNPLAGWKKPGDFSEEAVMKSYECMVEKFFPKGRVYLEGLKTTMRYSGPREAIFHAIIRRNLGCTHFIIGRDHAGVRDFYGTYEAHDFARRVATTNHLGIELLLLSGPYYCMKCGQIVSEKHCSHADKDILQISGTEIRAMLRQGKRPDERFMRPEIADVIVALGERMFISEGETS